MMSHELHNKLGHPSKITDLKVVEDNLIPNFSNTIKDILATEYFHLMCVS